MQHRDVIIVGAGGAGMMCAAEAAKRGRRVLLLDHGAKLGAKILISGGGRCNFTNLGAGPENYVSRNPHFCRSALARFTPGDFIRLVEKHGIAHHEKKLGQLFCDRSAQQIVDLLRAECESAGAEIRLGTRVLSIQKSASRPEHFSVATSAGDWTCESVVIATGGLSIPKIGASGFGYEIARQFGLSVVETRPALDGFVITETDYQPFLELAGVSADVEIEAGGLRFRENILFTHSGLSGPAALQASLHWTPGEPIEVDLLPDSAGRQSTTLVQKKHAGSRSLVRTALAERLTQRLGEVLCETFLPAQYASSPLPAIPDSALVAFENGLQCWKIHPERTVGYSKAEVTRGGVDTDELSSKTLEAKKVKGLYFIGEVVDVTGWLGGYNFQWAWASGWCAGQFV